ncbi:MAG: type II toxin-antitoxin system VapC family toxin [Candidatus Riflebacteria bacterium]|nr:type II toxin-antitoxin system VapC family toxin [Candidatus Riflebacteria bacterium]
MISVYLETSVISYLAAKPSGNLIVAAHQKITSDWWHHHRRHYDLAVSPIVEKEISLGDERTAQKRLGFIKGIRLLAVTPEAYRLAEILVDPGPLPEAASVDAFHIALAAVHGIDYLLSWNCKHIANVFIQKELNRRILSQGYDCPILCTPESMLEFDQ